MKNKGFTLIELMIVVAIVGILGILGSIALDVYTPDVREEASTVIEIDQSL